MFFKDKLEDWYGDGMLDYRDIFNSEDTFVFLVDLKDRIEIARVFQLGNTKEISIDSTFTKGDIFGTAGEIASFLVKKGYR